MNRRAFMPLLGLGALLPAVAWVRWSGIASTTAKAGKHHVLDTSLMVGAIPEIYGWSGGKAPLSVYFATAVSLAASTRSDSEPPNQVE
jgi:5-methyltetrahydropteroyltriglutamate--homocysteine methyltransferase